MQQQSKTCKHIQRREWLSFFVIVAIVFPLLTLGFIGAYGLVVWLLQ